MLVNKMHADHPALSFLEGAEAREIDGKKYLEMNGEMINFANTLSEASFVRDWLLGFAVGYVNEKPYFDFNGWLNLSNDGRSAIVIHDNEDENKFLFVIPPMISSDMTQRELEVLQFASGRMSNAYSAQFGGSTTRGTEILMEGMKIIQDGLDSKQRTLTDMIPPEVFAKYNIVPNILKKMIYCRDVFGVQTDSEMWPVLEACFKIIEERKPLKPEQFAFLKAITRETAVVPDECLPSSNSKLEVLSSKTNPFEC